MGSIDPWEGMRRLGGFLLGVAGALYIGNLALVISQGGALPTDGAKILTFVSTITSVIELSSILFFAIDTMLVLGFVALFLSFRGPNQTLAAVGAILMLLAMCVDLVNTLLFFSLAQLSNFYSAATNDGARVTYAGLAQYAGALSTGIGGSLTFVLLSLAILAMSVAMFRSKSWRVPAYFGFVAGILGLGAGVSGFVPLIILWPFWFILVGAKLYKKGP